MRCFSCMLPAWFSNYWISIIILTLVFFYCYAVPISVVSSFKKIKSLISSNSQLASILRDSTKLVSIFIFLWWILFCSLSDSILMFCDSYYIIYLLIFSSQQPVGGEWRWEKSSTPASPYRVRYGGVASRFHV